jgi:hypothetical protein
MLIMLLTTEPLARSKQTGLIAFRLPEGNYADLSFQDGERDPGLFADEPWR